jgi:N-methylhydantoinase B/oxoprolinase/acetone carboxylase alpha subunit
VCTPGGAGYGRPDERAAEARERDDREGRIGDTKVAT